MGNWTSISIDDLKAVAFGGIIDAANAQSTGSNSPAADAIADAVSAVRGAISTGNQLDIDPSKVPNSLKSLAARMAAFALAERIGLELSQDQRDTKRGDQSRLNRITDQHIRFELADNAGGSGEFQVGAISELVDCGNHGNNRHTLRGL